MGRKKQKKPKTSATTMTYVSKDNDITVVPLDSSDTQPEEKTLDPDEATNIKERQCNMCQKIMKTKHALRAHMAVHQDRTVQCDECDMMFSNKNALNRHKQCKHMDESLRPFPCHMCEKRFLNKSHLAAHVKTHTGERDVTCGLCFQSFYSKADLVRHMKGRHLNIRSFQCHLCARGFFRKSYLKLHLLTVHMSAVDEAADGKARLFTCRYCKKLFNSRTSCYTHERTHNHQGGDQRALCMICGKTFSRPSGLKKHLEKHAGPPKLRCEQCERPFYHPGSLKRHMLTHNRPDPDICQVCGTVYTNRDAFKRHLKRHVARGDIDQLPRVEREVPQISKMQALISQGVDLDEILKTCNVEVVELGGKNNSWRARNKLADDMIQETHEHDKWILDVDKINNSVTSHVQDNSWMTSHRVSSEYQFPVEFLGMMNHLAYSVVSHDVKSIVLNHSLVDASDNDSEATQTSLIFSIKSCLRMEDESDIFQKDVSAELFSPVIDIDIPKYVEEIPEIKQELLGGYPQVLFQCMEITVDMEVAQIDLDQDVYVVSIALERNMREVLKPLQILPRGDPTIDLEKGFDEYESNTHAPLPTVRSTEKARDLSEFRDMKQNIIEWTDEELQVKIANILNGKTRVFWINNLVNINEDSEQLNEIVAQMDTFTYEKELEQEAEVDDPDMDDFVYEDTADPVEQPSDSEPEVKPVVQLIEPKVEPDVPDGYDENKENKKKRKKKKKIKRKRKREVTDSEEEEYTERRKKKRGRKKKLKKAKTTKKKKVKVETKEEVDQIDEKEFPWNNVEKTICVEFMCFYCEKQCATKGTLRTHIRSMHLLDRSCSCDVCGMSFIAKSRLEAHIENVHLKVRNFQCASCEWSFYSRADLERHERRHSGIKPFMCHMCSKTFVRKAQLKAHIVIHSGERNFVCNMCGKGFATRSTLSTHLKRHTQGRPVRYYKPQIVGEGDYIRRIPGEPVMCNQCGKELSTPHSLKRHIALVHEKKDVKPRVQKPWQCPSCELSFGYRTSMQRHMYKFHENSKQPRTHACPVCGRRLLDETCVLRHMVKRHPYNCDDIDAMNAAVAKALQRHIPCPICKRKFLKEKGMQKHMAKKHFYKTDEYMEYTPLCPPSQALYSVPEEKPNLLLL